MLIGLNTQIYHKYTFFLALFLILSLLSSCSIGKYLDQDEHLVKENRIVYTSKLDPHNRKTLEYEIPQRILLKETQAFLWLTKPYIYLRRREKGKTVENKKIAQEPPYITPSSIKQSENSIKDYLYTHGYFDAEVSTKIDTGKYYSVVTYELNPGELVFLDTFVLTSNDSGLLHTVQQYRKKKFLTKGAPLTQDNLQNEVAQIINIARNHGYPEFYSNYVDELILDTTNQKFKAKLILLPYSSNSNHQKYYFGKVKIHASQDINSALDTSFSEIEWIKPLSTYLVKPKYLKRSILFKPNEIYSKQTIDQSLRNIAKYEIYKYPIIKRTIDSARKAVDLDIFLQDNDRLDVGGEVQMFYSNFSAVNNQVLGTAISALASDRNAFGGGEVFSINLESNFEFGLNNTENSSANAFTFSAVSGIRLPRFEEYPIFYWLADRLLPNSKLIQKIRDHSQTKFALEYQFTNRESFYTFNSIQATSGYIFRPNNNWTVEIDHLGINYWQPDIKPNFDDILGDNEFFRRGFSKRLITGILLQNVAANFNLPPNSAGQSYSVFGNIEFSGLEIGALERLAALFGANTPFSIGSGANETSFSKYVKFEISGVYNRRFRNKHQFAARLLSGVAIDLDGRGVPYIKQFEIGGPYSIRAFRIRELGPGSFYPEENYLAQNLPFYSKGDFKLEMNLEYRFPVAWIIEGGIFLEAGNVWNIDDEQEAFNLRWEAYKDIAIGSGLGLRFLFPYNVVARIDIGYPLRYPFELRDDQWIFNQDFKGTNTSLLEPANFNFAIGYAF